MGYIDKNDGWKIDANLSLIRHSCGFEAEYKGNEIYGINQFPLEATILDIRNLVSKAEEVLSSSYHQLKLVSSSRSH